MQSASATSHEDLNQSGIVPLDHDKSEPDGDLEKIMRWIPDEEIRLIPGVQVRGLPKEDTSNPKRVV